jgi:dUTP pyrophosphatase
MNEIICDTCMVPFVRLSPFSILPSYAHEYDAGMDICASEDVLILPGETKLVPTGLAAAIPEGYEGQIRPRSGISLRTMIRIPNSPGTIDSGYRDQISIIMHNASFLAVTQTDKEPITLDERNNRHGIYLIRRGDKIAQVIFARVARATISEVNSLDGIGIDRKGGFGSTGIQSL